MALQRSKIATGQKKVPSLISGLVGGLLYEHTISGSLSAGDIIELGPIEPGVAPIDTTLIVGDLDSNGTPTITLSVGILNAAKDDLSGTAFIVASTAGQTGGVARATTTTGYDAGSSSSERILGVKVVAGPATAASDGKKIAVVLDAVG